MLAFVKMVRALSRACGVAAAAMILVAVAVVCQMVFVRYVLNGSTVWQTPLVTYLLVAATFIGSPYVLLLRGHVNVDLLPIYMRGHGRLWLALMANGVSLAFCLVVLWYALEFWHDAFAGNWQSASMWRIPLWIPYLSLPLGFGLMVLQYAADLWLLASGREAPFGMEEQK
jgi:TRAP-type C4-dicarboxylate transport system permease small subunit